MRKNKKSCVPFCSPRWPLPKPDDWLQRLNRVEPECEQDAIRRALRRGSPFGGERWQKNTAVRLGLEFTLRPRE
ncbi:MAG: hypothetical protein IT426_11195 [Pirellulales bacterium]|nr:hypothetical protein [Pirellulales bacterium]